MADDFRSTYLKDILHTYRVYKGLAERAIAQVDDAALHATLDAESNSIAMLMKHISGNLRSRFTDFLTTDGEKPDRNRDGEFEMPERASREELLRWWESAWSVALRSIETLQPPDLDRTVTIRGEEFQVVEQLNRLASHAAYHVGQIVHLARHYAGSDWTSLSIPKGQSNRATGNYKNR
jgi:hypothetical protein